MLFPVSYIFNEKSCYNVLYIRSFANSESYKLSVVDIMKEVSMKRSNVESI